MNDFAQIIKFGSKNWQATAASYCGMIIMIGALVSAECCVFPSMTLSGAIFLENFFKRLSAFLNNSDVFQYKTNTYFPNLVGVSFQRYVLKRRYNATARRMVGHGR